MNAVLRTSAPTPLPALLSPAHLAGSLWRHRDLIRQFSWRMFVARSKGTQLGVLWSLAFPLTQLAVYVVVFTYVFKMRAWDGRELSGPLEFSVILFCGMIGYTAFAESVSRSCGLVVDNPNLVKKVVFPLEVLPVAALLSSLLYAAAGLVLVLFGSAFLLHGLSWWSLAFPLVLLPLAALSMGLGWLVAALSVFLRDTGNVTGIVVGQILFYLTPILYAPSQLPEEFRAVAALNPLAPVVEGARRTLLFGRPPDWPGLGWALLASLVVMQLGYAFFMKSKRGFADVL